MHYVPPVSNLRCALCALPHSTNPTLYSAVSPSLSILSLTFTHQTTTPLWELGEKSLPLTPGSQSAGRRAFLRSEAQSSSHRSCSPVSGTHNAGRSKHNLWEPASIPTPPQSPKKHLTDKQCIPQQARSRQGHQDEACQELRQVLLTSQTGKPDTMYLPMEERSTASEPLTKNNWTWICTSTWPNCQISESTRERDIWNTTTGMQWGKTQTVRDHKSDSWLLQQINHSGSKRDGQGVHRFEKTYEY